MKENAAKAELALLLYNFSEEARLIRSALKELKQTMKNPLTAIPILAYTVNEVVQATPLSRSVVYEEITAKRLRARKRGSQTIIMHEDLVAYLAALPNLQ